MPLMLKEFREFALKGNVVDLAVGIIIGAAFGKITTSLVNDVIMPPIGFVLGRIDFSSLFLNLSNVDYPSLDAAKTAGAPVIAYGAFISTVIDFAIVAFAVFILVRQINRLKTVMGPPPAPTEKSCPYCMTNIPLAATKCKACTADVPAT
jgi:large conductance mechanosensitive channel